MDIQIEKRMSENSEWEFHKSLRYNSRNAESAQKQAKKLIADGKAHQVHVETTDFTDDENRRLDVMFYCDGTSHKLW